LDLSDTDLSEAYLVGAELYQANLRRVNLYEAVLNLATLFESDLSGSDLHGADLGGADLTECNLSGTYLDDSSLVGTNLFRSNVRGANFNGARTLHTIFGDIDLRPAKGLDKVIHLGPSSVGVETIFRSQGDIPEVFLRGTGMPDTFITYMRSLIARPIEYYTCFISYSTRDDDFAHRLHADLQSKGVRCWFAPEDMKIGDEIRVRIDESIRLYDKLLVVLSENSVNSAWVEDEVEAALEKERLARERGEKQTVLFPIQLDDSVKGVTAGWPAKIRRTRNIGDFRNWNRSHADYIKAFKRLLRDLKAGT
jgi:uncharacterized protein YjbI with pentapeptide repeats